MFLPYTAVKVPLALFMSIEIVFPDSFQHGTLQSACSKVLKSQVRDSDLLSTT